MSGGTLYLCLRGRRRPHALIARDLSTRGAARGSTAVDLGLFPHFDRRDSDGCEATSVSALVLALAALVPDEASRHAPSCRPPGVRERVRAPFRPSGGPGMRPRGFDAGGYTVRCDLRCSANAVSDRIPETST